MTKRPSLKTLTSQKGKTAEAAPERAMEALASKAEPEYHGILFKADKATWRQFRVLSMDTGRSGAELLAEAVNLLFERHDMPQIAKHVSPPRKK